MSTFRRFFDFPTRCPRTKCFSRRTTTSLISTYPGFRFISRLDLTWSPSKRVHCSLLSLQMAYSPGFCPNLLGKIPLQITTLCHTSHEEKLEKYCVYLRSRTIASTSRQHILLIKSTFVRARKRAIREHVEGWSTNRTPGTFTWGEPPADNSSGKEEESNGVGPCALIGIFPHSFCERVE